jgi:hypothetical protein
LNLGMLFPFIEVDSHRLFIQAVDSNH